VSPGELIDKISILELKLQEFTDVHKIENVKSELEFLDRILKSELQESEALIALHTELRSVNKSIWDSENDVREYWDDEKRFNEAARNSHYKNDERARLKREINDLLGSKIIEEKSHPKYEHH